MKKVSKTKFFIATTATLILLIWLGMVITDYYLSTKATAPIFAQRINAADAAIYRGIGYRIVITTGYAVSPEWAELKGYFYCGN